MVQNQRAKREEQVGAKHIKSHPGDLGDRVKRVQKEKAFFSREQEEKRKHRDLLREEGRTLKEWCQKAWLRHIEDGLGEEQGTRSSQDIRKREP